MTDCPIVIDEYFADAPEILWICDHCGDRHPVTAQFDVRNDKSEGEPEHITLCGPCLSTALVGITRSYATRVPSP